MLYYYGYKEKGMRTHKKYQPLVVLGQHKRLEWSNLQCIFRDVFTGIGRCKKGKPKITLTRKVHLSPNGPRIVVGLIPASRRLIPVIPGYPGRAGLHAALNRGVTRI